MATFSEQITIEGHNLLAKMLAGEANITFTKMVLGDGNVTVSEMANIRQVVSPKVTLDIHSVLKDASNNVTITSIFSNEELEQGFYYREKGLYATDGGNEILFLYGNNGTLAEWISPGGSQVIEKKIISVLTFSETQDINVTIKSGVYVTSEELTLHNTNDAAHPNIQQRIDKLSNANLLINGDFRVWQRGEQFENITTQKKYTADRWKGYNTTSESDVVIKKSDEIGIRIEVSNQVSTSNFRLQYGGIEDEDLKNIIGKKAVISFYISELEGEAKLYIKEPDIWVKCKIGFNSIGFTINNDINEGLFFQFESKEEKQVLNIDWVKMELGEEATPFRQRLYTEELALCERYYIRSNTLNIRAYAGENTTYTYQINYRKEMRICPTVNAELVEYTNISSHNITEGDTMGCTLVLDVAEQGVYQAYIKYKADAEMY